jgi:putative pantetheine hydrolase
LFDLGRGGNVTCRPGPEFGRAAYDAAMASPRPGAGGVITAGGDALGVVGAGTGAVTGGLKGGVGMASAVLETGATVAALAVVNALGSVVHPATGTLYGAPFGLPGEFDWLTPPTPAALAAGGQFLRPPGRLPARKFNTTIGLIATDVPLTTAQCAKLAGIGHDGLARAVRPAHSMFDGDTIFGLSTGGGAGNDSPASPALFHQVLATAADCFSRAVVHGVLSATSVTTPSGHWPAYLDVFGSDARP